ncbi:MFS transporter [Tropicimonas sp. TH_r6]|uniref:MFS transporter n=1 Tax=Tropicimonas sp. TH_r6 TaxID=3082085 RepID=UPI00295450C4|nr:MFS transporter [Tropicimonas sp. TH_r6]MDV7143398.1 MFS transporter [Tropicimonas sp. TH_r6]
MSVDAITARSRGQPERQLIWLLSLACGVLASNVYIAQPLAGPISESLGLNAEVAGLVVTLTQIGYGAGLLLVVPLADRVENRRLILGLVALAGLGLFVAGGTAAATLFLTASLAIGLGSVCVQVLVPYAAHLVCESRRGQTIGIVTAGLMLGIMLARPAASVIAEFLEWHWVFRINSFLMLGLLLTLAARLPRRQPRTRESYLAVIASMLAALGRYRLLRERILYQAALFGGFSLFWTAAPIWLMQPQWGWSQGEIGLFAMTAATGALAAPPAGALADRGRSRLGTAMGLAMAAGGFLLTLWAVPGHAGGALAMSVAAALINAAVTFSFVIGQREIFGLDESARARLNGVFMASFTLVGAAFSALGGWCLARFGWEAVTCVGLAALTPAVLVFLRRHLGAADM